MKVPRPGRIDLLLPAALAVVGMVEIATAGYRPLAPALFTYVLAAGALSLARAAPLVVTPIVTSIYALTPLIGFDVSEPASWLLLIAFAAFGTGLYAPSTRRFAGLASVLAGLAITLAGLAWLTDFDPDLLFGLIVTVGPWALGLILREALDREKRAGEEAERARAAGMFARERAIAAERERITVELNDLLAHSLGAMVVQSAAAGDLVGDQPAAASRALDGVAQAGREALAETGRLLRLLRDDRNELGLGPRVALDAEAPAPARAAQTQRLSIRDCLLPALLGLIATAEILLNDSASVGLTLLAYWLATLLLCARRIVPLAMPIGVAGILIGARVLGAETDEPSAVILVGGVASFSAGRHAPRSRLLLGFASVLGAVGLELLDAVARAELSADVVLVLALALAPWLVGIALRETLARIRAMAASAERERLAQLLEAERAAAAERKRIARELHDVLANSLSVMAVQASLAADLAQEDANGAAAAVATVEDSGRAALAETGRLLRLISTGGQKAGTQPQHRLTDVPKLVGDYERAGLTIDLDLDLDLAERLTPAIELSVYRIVQEGLTNALKHAPGSRVRLRLERNADAVALEIENGRARANGRTAVPSGHGLAGLRERIMLFGGSLSARPSPDGGFLLAATIPLEDVE
jgi:signal transduction histidine kinase